MGIGNEGPGEAGVDKKPVIAGGKGENKKLPLSPLLHLGYARRPPAPFPSASSPCPIT
ncbi:hypothetical protein COO91_02974 [Nostoc flagelliforme CCNUN1]|uniref:Uncharacterized protein n=1 Tax=Nostoc flagelliforme CCNUN1 TaxID=2038116 RepID=A0A2K8SNL8_9NOSO|nr:hypothetical protein COO91_02974 [Nostoc flagelliforme CCNUN1]